MKYSRRQKVVTLVGELVFWSLIACVHLVLYKQAAWAVGKRVCTQEGYIAKGNAKHTRRELEKAFKLATVATADFAH